MIILLRVSELLFDAHPLRTHFRNKKILFQSLKALEDNSVRHLKLNGNKLSGISFSLYVERNIGPEGATKLSEALKSNTSLRSLYLSGNILLHFILTQYR
jgi:hypothetical protein